MVLAEEWFTTWGCPRLQLKVIPCPLRAGLFFDYAVKFLQKILLLLSARFFAFLTTDTEKFDSL